MNLALSASLNLVWSLMNTMQIIVHLPLVNLSFPSNAQTISVMFVSLANFDVVPHGYLNYKTFDFDQNLNMREARFALMGYGKTNFILNAGTSIWLIFAWASLALLSISIKFIKTKHERFNHFRLKLNHFVFF